MSAKDHKDILRNSLYRNESRDQTTPKPTTGIGASVYNDVLKHLNRMTLLRHLYDNLKKENGIR